MPFAERAIRDADGVEGTYVGFEMQPQRVVGEWLWRGLELAKTQPWEDGVDCVDSQKPEGGKLDENVDDGLLGAWKISHSVGCEYDKSPESGAA